MLVQKDYEDLLRLFNKHKVKYCIVGAFAVAFHGYPRYTKDIDIVVEPSAENGEKIIKAIDDFGFRNIGLTKDDFVKLGQVIQLGYEPIRIDIINSISGCSFKDIWKNKKTGMYGLQRVYFAGVENLIKNKRAVGRKIDIVDLESLQSRKPKKRKRS